MHRQLNVYFENILWKYQCGSRKSCYSAGETLDKGDMSATLLADCLPYDVLIAKLHAYGIEWLSRRLLYSCYPTTKKRFWLNNSYSTWSEILFGVPQGSDLGPLFFNIFLCDLFLFISSWHCKICGWQHIILQRWKYQISNW